MSDSMRNTVLAGCGVAVVCLVLGFLVGMSAGTPVEEPYFVSTHSARDGWVLNLVRHNQQTGETEFSRVDFSGRIPAPPRPWETVPE